MKSFLFNLLILFYLLFPISFSFADKGDTKNKDFEIYISEEKTELEKLKKKIEKENKKIDSMGKKEGNILKILENLDDRLKLKERELQIYNWNIELNNKKTSRLTLSIGKLENDLKDLKQIIGHRLRTIYKEGDVLLVKILFSSDSFSDMLQRIKFTESIMSYDSEIFQSYSSKIKKLKIEKDTLIESREKLIKLEGFARIKKKEAEKEKKAKYLFLKKIKNKKNYIIQTRRELLKASKKLNEIIKKLREKLVLGEGLSLTDVKGRLRFPVEGKILNRFGKRKDKKYNSYIVNNGINLKVDKGKEVRSIFHGKVLYRGFLEGYGNLIILGHGNNYHSLYGHLDKFLVETGELVEEGVPVGISGDSGSLKGEVLYFELRHKGKPIDPKPWFRLAKK